MGDRIERGRGWGGAQAQVGRFTLELSGLSESLAEQVLAVTWCALEQHALSTPMIEIGMADNLIELRLTFRSSGDRALVEQALRESPHFAMALTQIILQ